MKPKAAIPPPMLEPGEWVRPVRKGWVQACCDCGLVHRWNFRIRKGRVYVQAFRDNELTRKVRRAKRHPKR